MPSTDPKEAPLTYVSAIELSGSLNGVVNVLFNQIVYVPVANADGTTRIEAQKVYPLDLRLDLYCTQQLHEALGNILADQTKPKLAS